MGQVHVRERTEELGDTSAISAATGGGPGGAGRQQHQELLGRARGLCNVPVDVAEEERSVELETVGGGGAGM